eukprot:Colp12_sorted_trinity150504_noHs@30257
MKSTLLCASVALLAMLGACSVAALPSASSRSQFPTPVLGTFYPIYNSGKNQYIVPTSTMPFNQVNLILAAFGHVYIKNDTSGAAVLDYEQKEEISRLPLLIQVAKSKNPDVKVIISLGWGHSDWDYVNRDHQLGERGTFVQSVVDFVRNNKLDGFDIDDESVYGISQAAFDDVVKAIRAGLDKASLQDGKPYFMTITPAFGTAQVTKENMDCFDLILTQNYGGSYPSQFTALGYPAKQIAQGSNMENGCNAYSSTLSKDFGGAFTWTFSADSNCNFSAAKGIYQFYKS